MHNKYKQSYSYLIIIFLLSITPQICSIAQSNQYLHFDGVNDRCITPNASEYIAGLTNISMTAWVNSDQLGYGQGMLGFRGAGEGFYLLQLDNGKIECRFQNSSGSTYDIVAPDNSIVPGEWQHLAFTYGDNELAFYINGDLIDTRYANGSINSTDLPFGIATTPLEIFNFFMKGGIDEVSLWSKTISQSEILNIIEYELTGYEPNLELYYKFNQGVPEGDNTGIEYLTGTVLEGGNRDAQIQNMNLTGEESNFLGTLEEGYQVIEFPIIENKLISSSPFEIEVNSSSGLPIDLNLIEGPAELDGYNLSLTGEAGTVKLQANQAGNEDFSAATPAAREFEVLDPSTTLAQIEPRTPYDGAQYYTTYAGLSPILLSSIVTIDFPELFEVSSVYFLIDGAEIEAKNWDNQHYSAWWSPWSTGDYNLLIRAENNFGEISERTVNFSLVGMPIDDLTIEAVDGEWLSPGTQISTTQEVEFPCHLNSFENVTALLELSCPPTGGCGEWDVIVNIDAKGYNGEWVNIIRYITPYGKACSHSIDLTDYRSLFQGKSSIRIQNNTYDNGYIFDLDFVFTPGITEHRYSSIEKAWNGIYPFGQLDNLQPVEDYAPSIPDNTEKATLKLLSTGHGWGDNNTNNAAEFSDNTHHIYVNGLQTYTQHNWSDCNPNPDGCNAQAGTWEFNRAGWCPGSIAPYFDYDMTSYLQLSNLNLNYIFDEDYIDYCSPANPDCNTSTCPDCNDGFKPDLHVISNMVYFSNSVMELNVGQDELASNSRHIKLNVQPNPFENILELRSENLESEVEINLLDLSGKLIKSYSKLNFDSGKIHLNLEELQNGIYFVQLNSNERTIIKKVIKFIKH